MDTLYRQAVSLAVPVFLALVALELIIDRVRGTRYYHLADAINGLSCGVVSTGMRVFFGFLGIFTYQWVLAHWSPLRLPSNNWAVWIFAFVLYDLCYYWNHRMGHTSGLFWASHVVHHQSEEFNLTTALRQTGTGSFTSWIFYLPMALCGIPLSVFLLVGVVQLFYQFWPHTRVIGRLGVLDRWIQTPSNHRVHHAQNDIYLDRNYVGVFLIWDHIFGSFQEELDEEPCIFGIRGQLNSWNPVWANVHYYWAMAMDCWRARSWWDKFRVWFMHPGWRPAELHARFPKKPYDPRVDFVRYDQPRGISLGLYGLVQLGALIAANSHFLAVVEKQNTAWNVLYFLFTLGGLACLGGVLENRREFVMIEGARLALTGLAVLSTGAWFGGVHDPRVLIGIECFSLLSLVWLWQAARAKPVAEAASAAA
jgi:alkylglycerol monooxygenase